MLIICDNSPKVNRFCRLSYRIGDDSEKGVLKMLLECRLAQPFDYIESLLLDTVKEFRISFLI